MRVDNTMHKKHGMALAIAAVMFAPVTQAADVSISGFLSVGGGMVDDESSISYDGYSEEDLTFDRNLLGLQVTGQVNEKITATAQLIARSGEDYEVTAEWAYLTWQASDNGKVRAGRLRTPLYTYSDSLDVGYSYPWISAPNEVYYIPLNNVDGLDYYLTAPLGSFDTSFQAYYGSFDSDFIFGDGASNFEAGTRAEASLRKQMGVAATFGRDWWNFRAAFHQADLTVNIFDPALNGLISQLTVNPVFSYLVPRIAVEDDSATFAQVGLNIDTGRFIAAAEHVEFDVKDSLLAKNVRDYVMVGVRLGNVLLHVTGSKADDEAADLASGVPVSEQTAQLIGALQGIAAAQAVDREVLSLGARWDVSSGTALKLQLDDVDDSKGGQKVLSVALQAVF